MKHFLYRVTNTFNQRFYVGMHSTENADDGYLGSGKRIKAEVKKYGKENFEKVILEELPTRKALKEREREIVDEDLMKDPLCLNLKNGGEGGGTFWSAEQLKNASIAGNRSPNRNHTVIAEKILTTKRERNSFNRSPWGNWEGRKHSEESKAKMKATKAERAFGQGEKNSQFGSCWVTDGLKPIKIKKENLDEYIQNGYRRGRV